MTLMTLFFLVRRAMFPQRSPVGVEADCFGAAYLEPAPCRSLIIMSQRALTEARASCTARGRKTV